MLEKKSNQPISFIIFAYNEEKRLRYVIQNFIRYGAVYILDGGSTDATESIAKEYGAHFVRRPENKQAFMETEENFQFIKSVIKTDWIYWGYTDNIAPKTLVEEMIRIAQKNKYKCVNIPLYTYLWGDTSSYIQKSYAPFLFHKDYKTFKKNYIHGLGFFTGSKDEEIFLPNNKKFALSHFSTYDLTKFVQGHLRYADTEARQKFDRGERFSMIKLVAAMIRYMFIYGRQCWKKGQLGWLIILSYPMFRLMTYFRLYELENNITLATVEDNYSKKKEEMLKEFK